MKVKNETEIQLLKILFKTNGKKATKSVTSPRAYPRGLENKYYRQLKGFFEPLTDYVTKYINEHMEPLLRGDAKEIRLDAIPGDTFREMLFEIEDWLSVYMPDISELPEDSNNNIIMTALDKTADEAMEFGNKEFSKMLEKGINVNLPTSAEWWNDMRNSWAEDNYTLITSNAKNYVSKINTLTEQAIVNGMSPSKLKEEIKKATEGLSDKHCKLLARDQMGKLNGQITQAQMQEIDLDLYIWSTAYDDRVRDSHALMEGLLCRWDDASVCSYDNGKTWVDRPSGAVQLHPGQDIQCRCVALAFYPELVSNIEGVNMDSVIENDEFTNEMKDNMLADLTESQKEIYDDVYKEFYELDGNRNNAIEISYACASGDFTNMPSSVFNKRDYDWEILENKIKKSMELYDSKTYVVNQFEIARDIFQKGGALPKFTCTEKELANYIEYLKKDKVFNSFDKFFEKKYGYEKYIAFAREMGTSYAGQCTYYRGLLDYMNLKNKDLLKLSYNGLKEEFQIYTLYDSKSLNYFDNCLSKANIKIGEKFNINDLMKLTPQPGSPWGTASVNNKNYKAIAMFDTKIAPFDKATQKIINVGIVEIDSEIASQGISQKMFCEQNYPLNKKLTPSVIRYGNKEWKYHNNEFMRLEFSYDGKEKNYKVGQILKQTGVFATSPSELHNAYWCKYKMEKCGAKYPVRFHLQRTETSTKYLSNVIKNDLHLTNQHTFNNPEEFDFSIDKLKITKIKNGHINGDKNFPVKEIWVEIVE